MSTHVLAVQNENVDFVEWNCRHELVYRLQQFRFSVEKALRADSLDESRLVVLVLNDGDATDKCQIINNCPVISRIRF